MVKFPKKKGDRVGMIVRTIREIRSGNGVVMKGTLFIVTSWHMGAHLCTMPCNSCGTIYHVNKVLESDIETTDLPDVPTHMVRGYKEIDYAAYHKLLREVPQVVATTPPFTVNGFHIMFPDDYYNIKDANGKEVALVKDKEFAIKIVDLLAASTKG